MNKSSGIRLPARAGAWYVASSALIKLCGMAATPYFTRVMSPDEYGTYSLYMSWIAILSVLMTLGLGGSAIYRGMQKFDPRGDVLTSAALGLALCSVAAFSAVGLLFFDRLKALISLPGHLIAILFLQIALDSVLTLYMARCRYRYGYRLVIGISAGSALTALLLSALLSRILEPTATMRALSLLAATAVFALPVAFLVFFKGKRLFSSKIWGFLARFNLPLLPHLLASSVMTNLDKVLIRHITGDGLALAGFSVAHSLGAGVGFISSGLGSALNPWIMRKIAQNRQDKVAEVGLKLTCLVALGSVAVLTLAPEILSVLAPRNYSSALPSVYPITVSSAVSFIGTITATTLIRAERTGSLSLCSLIGAAVNAGVSLLLLPISFNGAAIAHFAAALASLSVGIILTRRLPGKNVVKLLPSVAVIASSAFLSFILYALRGSLVPRLGILAAIVLVGLLCLFRLKKDVLE